MRLLGVKVEENPHYCSYDDECWIRLAQEIMNSYAIKYSYQLPTTALSQEEYNRLDLKTFLPIRKSILRNIMNGPLRNIASAEAIYSGLEKKRLAYKKSMGIIWEESEIDLSEFEGRN